MRFANHCASTLPLQYYVGRVTGAVHSTVRVVAIAVWTGAAYYAGAALGFALKLPDATPSVLWPPNAILTSTLLLTPTRLWPLVLAAALPAHLLIEGGVGWPMTFVLAIFATNCSEALIGAAGLRRLSDAPLRFDSLRRFGLFVGVVVVAAPLLSSFLDAAAVTSILHEPYWRVWRARLLSNVLTELIFVPAIVAIATSARTWLSAASRSRHVEALLFAASLVLAGIVVLHPPTVPTATALANRAPITVLLPFFLWGAFRFGPGGASVTLLGSTLAVVVASVYSTGPFHGFSPGDTTRALQLYLIVVSLTVLGVTALVEERRLVQQDLTERLDFEALLARLSGAFVQLPSDRMHGAFDEWLGRVGEFLRVDRLRLYQYTVAEQDMKPMCAWMAPGAGPPPDMHVRRDFPYALDRLLHRQPVIVTSPPDFPLEAERDRQSLEAYGFKSYVVIPLLAGEKVVGALAFTSTRVARTWPPTLVAQLRLIAESFGNALARKQNEDLLRTSEATSSAILTSLVNGVVVMDRDGSIIAVNEQWRRMAVPDASPAAFEIGQHHLDFHRAASAAGHQWARAAAAGLESVIRGVQPTFVLEYEAAPDRWFLMRVVPLERPEGGAVATYTDVSERRHAELEAQRMRGELAHVSRVSTMGALTASLAHQLNQPLTGVLTNAQAAQRFLQSPRPDLGEVRASLSDIVNDSRRARDVIVRVRELLSKSDGSREDVDLRSIVNDVVRVVTSDAIIRDAAIDLQLGVSPALVHGDRVQLQQVVLNLIVNALEAVADRPHGDRMVIVRCARTSDDSFDLAVIDSGPGFAPGDEETMFEAFHTTKRNGMGMGLSIARSIVEAHGGTIRAWNNTAGGATVCCTLPVARRVAA